MSRDSFITVMRIVHDALFKLRTPSERDEVELLNDLINAYISMIAGFQQWLYEELRKYLLTNPEATNEDFGAFYDMLTFEPDDNDQ